MSEIRSAIVIATGHGSKLAPLTDRQPGPMIPLIDRPFLQHVIESLVNQGVTTFDFLLSEFPEQIESFFGDGTRWGSKFRFHLVRSPSAPLVVMGSYEPEPDRPFLLVRADCLPSVDFRSLEATDQPVLFDLPSGEWSGWGVFPASYTGQFLRDLALDDLEPESRRLPCSRQAVTQCLAIRTFQEILESHSRMLAERGPDVLLTGREVEPGVWLSRNVSLHPSVRIHPPVYIGENCRIGAGAILGPDAVVGKGCTIESRSTISRSAVLAGSYVGEALELEHVIVDRNRLINVALDTSITVTDDFILGSMTAGQLRDWVGGAAHRIAAVILWIFFLPLMLLSLPFRGKLRGKLALQIPAESEFGRCFPVLIYGDTEKPLSHFFFRFLPGLASVVAGDLRLVGVEPRTREEIAALPPDWRSLYLHSKAGLVTEAFIQFEGVPTEDELYASEAFYAVSRSPVMDLKLLLTYFARVIGHHPASNRRDPIGAS